MRTPVTARWFTELHDAASLPALLEEQRGDRPALILGEGSNCLFKQDYDGLVIKVCTRGIEILEEGNDWARLRVAAGENWHAFVRWTLSRGYSGVENLALIPGTVGAAPIQNIGAYGVEVDRCIESVEAWDTERKARVTLDQADCAFSYRDSLFKQEPGHYVVLFVNFRLSRVFRPVLDYTGLRERLASRGHDDPSPTDVADAVESLRREKLPDPAVLGNAGSFFKNPIVDAATADALLTDYPDMPVFPVGDQAKLSAAWLIEKSGMKGYRNGDAAISDRHALVLVNHGNASGEQLWEIASMVRDKVSAAFRIDLEPEPRVY